MRLESTSHYYIYLVTNDRKTALQAGLTGDLSLRLYELEKESRQLTDDIAADNFCRHLVWWEHVTEVEEALKRSKQIEEYSLKKKLGLVSDFNPGWEFLNKQLKSRTQMYL